MGDCYFCHRPASLLHHYGFVLQNGRVTIVDQDDYEAYKHIKWYCNKRGYAQHDSKKDGKRTRKMLHRIVMGVPNKVEIDHINGDSLDNRKANLRVVTHKQNMMNIAISSRNTTGYKGVSAYKPGRIWRAYIRWDNKQVHLGYFRDPVQAARAYNAAADRLYGEFARKNNV